MSLAPALGASRRAASPSGAACVGVGLAGAMALRLAVAGGARTTSVPAAIAFTAALLAVSAAAGWRPSLPPLRGIAIGLGGGVALCAGPILLRLHGGIAVGAAPLAMLPSWAAGVTAVAVAEEVLLRGVLFDALTRWRGEVVAVAVTALAFGLLHVPLYGLGALPLDVAVGVWLGGLRLAGGGVTAPATAHTVADLAAWWLR